jgi:ATP-dependent helicase/nuclease subunit A
LSPDASGNAADEAAARRGKGIHLLLQLLDENQASAAAAMRSRLQGKLQGAVTDAEFRGWLTMAQAVKEAPGLKRFFDPAQYRQAWNEVSVPHDYKTTPHTDAAALDQRHRTQLQAYAASVRRIWPGRPLRAGLVLTESREWLELLRSED